MKQLDAQFCVVGSGISGLAAAYRLHRAGASVMVLEADRIGGRIHSGYLSDNQTMFEIGAEWISDDSLNPALRQLMKDLVADQKVTFPTFDQYVNGSNTFIDFDGSVHYYDAQGGGLPPISKDAQEEIKSAFQAMACMSTRIEPTRRWIRQDFSGCPSPSVSNSDEADRMSLHNWLEKNFSTPAAKALVAAMYRGVMGLDPEAISLLHCLFFLRTFGSNPFNVLGAGPGQMQHLRLSNGVERILDAMVNAIGIDRFQTGSPVRDIEWSGDQVVVRTDEVSVRASKVIVATSTTAVNMIRFHPPLPPDRAQLQQRMGIGSFWKVWLAYDRPFWRAPNFRGQPEGLSGAIVCIQEGSYVATTLDSSPSNDGPGLMTCFIDAGRARAFAALSAEGRKKAILEQMVLAFGTDAGTLSSTYTFPAVAPQAPAPSPYFEWNWSLPEFIRGDYAAAPGPGVYTAEAFGPAIYQPVGNVYWAGSDNGVQCYGAMEGAVSSAERVVAEILEKGSSTGKG